jgi:hypothetical protein
LLAPLLLLSSLLLCPPCCCWLTLLLLVYPAVASDPVVAVPPALASLKNQTFWTVGLLDYDYQTIDYWTINLGKLSNYQYRTKESNFWTYDLSLMTYWNQEKLLMLTELSSALQIVMQLLREISKLINTEKYKLQMVS